MDVRWILLEKVTPLSVIGENSLSYLTILPPLHQCITVICLLVLEGIDTRSLILAPPSGISLIIQVDLWWLQSSPKSWDCFLKGKADTDFTEMRPQRVESVALPF